MSTIEAASFEIEMPTDEDNPEFQYQQQAQRISSKTKKNSTSSKFIDVFNHFFLLIEYTEGARELKEMRFKSQSMLHQQLLQEKQQQAATKGIINMQQHATLVTLFIMLSTVSHPRDPLSSDPSTPHVCVDLLLMAQHWVIRIWQVFYAHAAKFPPLKPGKEPSFIDLPKSVQEWATLIISDETSTRLRAAGNPFMVAVNSHDGLVTGLGSEAFLKYLLYLAKQLEFHGYYLHSLPVLALSRVLVCELNPRSLVLPLLAQLHLMYHNVCQKMHLDEAARMWMELADGNFFFTIFYRMYTYNILGTVTQAYEARILFNEELQYHELLQAMQKEANFFSPPPSKVAYVEKAELPPVDKILVRHVYRDLAKSLIGIYIYIIFCCFY